MFSLESFHKQYETDTSNSIIKQRSFSLFVPKYLDRFIDPDNLLNDFPLWSKIWEASIVLADYMACLPVEPGKRFFEIGCGLGLVGIVGSSFGHKIIMTESNPDALNFARANAEINPPPADLKLEILELDWNNPRLDGAFDYIVGSEVIYKEGNYDPILKLIRACLKPGGEVILAEGVRKTSMEFFSRMEQYFVLRAQKKILRSKEKEARVVLCRMRLRDEGNAMQDWI